MNIVGLFILFSISLFGFKNDGLPWPLVAAVFCATVFIYNIHFPNLYAFAQEITAKEDYSRVTSMLETQGQITFTIAGGLAAMLLSGISGQVDFMGQHFALPFNFSAWKIHEIFALDAATYLIAFLIIYRIKSLPVVAKQIDTTPLRERIKSGFSFLKQRPLLFTFGNATLLVFLTVVVFSTYVQPTYVSSFLHSGGNVYALGEMTFSFGAVLAGLFSAKIFSQKSAVKNIIALSVVAGFMYVVMTLSNLPVVFLAADFVIGMCNSSVRILRVTYLFHHIPNHIIGRASSVFFMFNVFLRLCLIAAFTTPFFHQSANVLYAVICMAIVCFAGAIALAVNYKRLHQEPEVA